MNITDLFMTILVLMGLAVFRFGLPLLIIWLINLALLKLAPPSSKTIETSIS